MTVGSGLGGAGACEAVAVAMAMFPDHRFIQVEGCRAIEALADGDAENVKRLGQAVSVTRKVLLKRSGFGGAGRVVMSTTGSLSNGRAAGVDADGDDDVGVGYMTIVGVVGIGARRYNRSVALSLVQRMLLLTMMIIFRDIDRFLVMALLRAVPPVYAVALDVTSKCCRFYHV